MKYLNERVEDNIKIDVKGIGCDGIIFRVRNKKYVWYLERY
jgi:hypothetical protein